MPFRRRDRDAAPVRRDQFLADEEAQPQPSPRWTIGARDLIEAREQVRQLVGRDAPAVILYLQRDLGAHAPQPHVDRRRARRVGASVGEQIDGGISI